MKTKTVATATLVALLLAMVSTAALATTTTNTSSSTTSSSSSTTTSTSTVGGHGNDNDQGNKGNHGNHGDDDHHGPPAACDNLTLGETLTVSGLTGHYANASNREMHGNASGTFTFKVTGIFAEGCTLSITGGSFKLNTTSYTVTGGSIVLNQGGRSGEGSGTTSSGMFLINISGLHGNSKSASVGGVGLDFETGKSQFLVNLHSMQAHSPPGDSDNDGD